MGFDVRVLLHVAGILLTVLLLGWCALHTQYYATMLVLGLVLLAQVSGLLRLVHTTNRELARFLDAMKYMDLSQSFGTSGRSRSFRELSSAFNAVAERFRLSRSEREQQAAWLLAVVQHLPVAVLVLDERQRVLNCNTAAQRLLGRNSALDSLDAVARGDAALAGAISALQPGDERMLKRQVQADTQQLKLSCTLLRNAGQLQKLVCIQNIEGELEGRELEAWQNLIRVMTHEIMNSVTPITSLAETAEHYMEEGIAALEPHSATAADTALPLLRDASSAVGTISRRSQALLRFVTSYRKLSRLPRPQPALLQMRDVLQRVQQLLGEQLRQQHITLQVDVRPQTLQLIADPEQLEQALINLLRNAIDAVAGRNDPRITLTATLEEGGSVALTISDNGCGISADNIDNIFVPFFTTKRGGSGIGMTVVKQIIRANHGRISLTSVPGQGTTIRLLFRQY